jgi:hypothetical protein
VNSNGGIISTSDSLIRPSVLSGNQPAKLYSSKAGRAGEGNNDFSSEGRRATDFYFPRPGLNLRTLGPMASTPTITPP